MLVNFVGSPLSGKTTIAAAVFASLKELGYPVEFISERARFHIAQKRLGFGASFSLSDEDQQQIFLDQLLHERTFQESSKDSIVIADSSPLLSLLYMSDEGRASFVEKHKSKLDQISKKMQIVFHCQPILDVRSASDQNRITPKEMILKLDEQIPSLLKQYAPSIEPVLLSHRFIRSRTEAALSRIFTAVVEE